MRPPASATRAARIEHLDALRGLALFGIAVVNIGVFASPWWGLGAPDPAFSAPLDRIALALVATLFEMKFYLLFSFLFGYSFSLQQAAAARAGQAFAPRMGRRLLGLWLIGALHAALLFHGDILTTYALMGALLLGLSRAGETAQLRIAHGLIVATALAWAALGILAWLQPAPAADAAAQAQAVLRGFTGAPAGVLAARADALTSAWPILLALQAPCALAMFLYGLAAGRRTLAARLDDYRPLLRRLRRVGFAVGLPAALALGTIEAWPVSEPVQLWVLALSLLTAPLLSLAYAALALPWFAGGGARIADRLAPAGRMALSNYLLQSAAMALLFTGYGLGWMGRISPAATLAIVLALFAAQLCLSRAWLRRFAYGPVEWLLRAATIGAWPRMGKAAY
ncbi:DUF418 domain-containing protein [Lysobacter enzymogenes]|uniref:DUF418 domain-containing protein n=1 Tax=Lysobacter enzymogenes TaxID=69 RepID=UPI00099CDC5D|nr:DUF418 domain-containing protein [Lysobacter enzymogenes]UZW61329.1 DUF418 domain-containing protein [Lysobacter enzymogenes]